MTTSKNCSTGSGSRPFVFNLCDEGYRNDPFFELHVTTMLEILGIPYSGAGPACLGLCYNKNHIRAIAESPDVPVPMETYGPVPILVQEYLTGPEYSVGAIGNPGLTYRVLPPLDVDYSKLCRDLPPILGYESKWHPDSPYWNQISCHEAHVDDTTRNRLIDYANTLFKRTGCRDYARFDFRSDTNGVIKLLEVNPNPGWCWDGKLNFMADEGLGYADLLR